MNYDGMDGGNLGSQRQWLVALLFVGATPAVVPAGDLCRRAMQWGNDFE